MTETAIALMVLVLAASHPPQLGDAVPELGAATLDGQSISPARLVGKALVVDFFATWCLPCRESLADLARVTLDADVQLVIVDQREAPQVVRAYLKTRPLPANALLLLDPRGEASVRWGVQRLPTTFLIDQSGTIRHINRGHGPGYGARVARWLGKMLVPAMP